MKLTKLSSREEVFKATFTRNEAKTLRVLLGTVALPRDRVTNDYLRNTGFQRNEIIRLRTNLGQILRARLGE